MFDRIIVDHANKVRNDDYLHFSSHLQHMRHAVVSYTHGYPEVQRGWGNIAQLFMGTAMHEEIHRVMADTFAPNYFDEISVPIVEVEGVGWTGTADAVVDVNGQRWLVDYKTTSSQTFEYLNGQPKDDHILQVSAYYHFLPLDLITPGTKCGVLYIPTSPNFSRKWAEPQFMEFEPLPRDDIMGIMKETATAIALYRDEEVLPPVPEGEWKWTSNKRKGVKELIYKPHWSTRYCPWAALFDDPCGCSEEQSVFGGTYHIETGEFNLEPVTKHLSDDFIKSVDAALAV